MRFEKGHKAETRRRIVETASEKFRRDGVNAAGIAALMAEAGLTHGGFYAHFDSKEALVQEALDAAFNTSRLKHSATLEELVRAYLRPAHRDMPGRGCAIATLAPEIARHPPGTREKFGARVDRLTERIAALLPPRVPAPARLALATGILGVLIGTLQMSRTATSAARSDEILESGILAALRLAAV